jgi:hypothetical protein
LLGSGPLLRMAVYSSPFTRNKCLTTKLMFIIRKEII